MKIVCDNCATKYSIADEKVRGKVFKIRCKKCSHIIVVKGTEGGAVETGASSGDAAPEVGATSGEAAPADGWHVVINGEQVGPLQPDEIRAKFHAGEIDAESYAWREGFGDWQRLASIDEFRDLAAAAAPSPDATRRTGGADIFGGGGGDPASPPGGDLFGAPAGGDLFAGGAPAQAASPGGGLFAQADAGPAKRSATPGFGQPSMTDAPASEAKLTGQRNESSVLFSLNNLQALASGGGGAKGGGGAATASPGVDNRPGFANSQTEGSGLIDIRAMAAATLSSSPASSHNKSDDLPSFSSAPVFSPIAAPILMPSAPSGPPRWIWPVIALGVAAVASIIVVGVLILTKKPEVAVAPAAPVAAAPVAGATGTTPPPANTGGTPAANPGTTAANPGATTAPTPEAKAEPKADKGSKGASHGSSKAGKTAAAVPSSPSAGSSPSPAAPAPAPTKKGGKKDELDDLLNGASPEKPKKSAAREPDGDSGGGGGGDLPDTLDKGAIVAGMNRVKGKVQGCYEQYKVPGLAMVSVTISHNGKVSNASVSGAFAGTPTGDCVARAVKGATFSSFKNATQTVNYPYSLR
jgi:predicted Zn finger-like uncharacterized protein